MPRAAQIGIPILSHQTGCENCVMGITEDLHCLEAMEASLKLSLTSAALLSVRGDFLAKEDWPLLTVETCDMLLALKRGLSKLQCHPRVSEASTQTHAGVSSNEICTSKQCPQSCCPTQKFFHTSAAQARALRAYCCGIYAAHKRWACAEHRLQARMPCK